MKRLSSAIAIAVLAAACTGPAEPHHMTVLGADGFAFVGDGSRVTFSGLAPHAKVPEVTSSTDTNGVRWRLKTTARADAVGRIAVDDATYAAMTPVTTAPRGLYYWGDAPQGFVVTVAHEQRTVRRQLLRHAVTATKVRSHGLSGTLYDGRLAGRHPAVLLIGGSEGGEPGLLVPSVIAAYGYPVLSLAYFKAPGLPDTLHDVPLEYFRSALEWLAAQPDVDPKHLFVQGASRGGEAALLIGATYPQLVAGVMAAVPSSNVVCGFPLCSHAAWTLGGTAVPFTRESGVTPPTDDSRAQIAVERIAGPVLVSCGGLDQVWPSCTYAKAVAARRAMHHLATIVHDCVGCGHFAGDFLPGEPTARRETSGADRDEAVAFFTETLRLLARASQA